ncbi:uncharacterized protein LOC132668848 [Panthera onca]|uniref:pro-neuregulin-4, membrane-bound isoform isoform X1 n=1 Tax=Panthera onca TaxID=9690 RepID=UPI0029534F4D|nr:pro-neuregulin-4, membrane-bound isoform isoform X1 [Panthera onca]XP_060473930.1 pro-neuregulin-4, membrane-bound isoform isoform X1 [Panthera onca]
MKVSGEIPALPDTHPANLDWPLPRARPQDPDTEAGKPQPRPASRTHTCCLGSGFAWLCSGAGRSSRSRGSPVRPPAPSRLCRSLGSSAHRARGRARGLAPAAYPGPRLRPRLPPSARAPPAAAERRRGCLGNSSLGGSGWRLQPGRGRGLGSRQGPNAARRRRGVDIPGFNVVVIGIISHTKMSFEQKK